MQKWFYIQWHNDTHNLPQIQEIIMDYGWDAYGVYVALTELLHKNGGRLPLFSLKSVAWSLHISPDRLREFVERYVSSGLMTVNEEDELTSIELSKQFNKQKTASNAAYIRWNKPKEITDNKQQPTNQQQPTDKHTDEQPVMLSDAQNKSVDLLTNKLKYTQEKAETLARAYSYDYIQEKYNYLVSMINKHISIRSPHAYFEKALLENWVSSDDVVIEKTEPKEKNISYNEVELMRFYNTYKTITHTDFPKDKCEDFQKTVSEQQINYSLVIDCIDKYKNDNNFWEKCIQKEDVLDCSVFFDRQKAAKVIEYEKSKNIFNGQSVEDIINIIGECYGK